jgi:glycosyltransferase involved in cell wall biosynthesis
MKISFIEPHIGISGGIRRVLEFSNRLVDRGERVTIYHPGGAPCDWMECKAAVKDLAFIRNDDHEVVIFNDPPQYKIARRVSARLKVFYILGLYDRERLERFSLKILWHRRGRVMSLKRALEMPFYKITNAGWMQEYLREKMGVDARLVMGGVNRAVFRPVEVEKDGGVRRVLCSGDPREYKGTKTVEEAFRIVERELGDVELDMYHGKNLPQERMAEVYCKADVFVDAQWGSGCGWNNPVLEAMACRVPVVCTDIEGVRDFAFDGETALLVPERHPVAMARAVVRLLRDAGLRSKLGAGGFEISKLFDWEKGTEELLSALEEGLRLGIGRW